MGLGSVKYDDGACINDESKVNLLACFILPHLRGVKAGRIYSHLEPQTVYKRGL